MGSQGGRIRIDMIDPEYTRIKHQSCIFLVSDQSKGLRSVACWPAGADRRKATHATATAAMMTARISVDCRHPDAILTATYGTMRFAVPSPVVAPTADKTL